MKPQSLGRIRWWEFSGRTQKYLGEFFFQVPREYTTGWTCPFTLFKCLVQATTMSNEGLSVSSETPRDEGHHQRAWHRLRAPGCKSDLSRCGKVISRSTKQFLFIKKTVHVWEFLSRCSKHNALMPNSPHANALSLAVGMMFSNTYHSGWMLSQNLCWVTPWS